MRPAYAIAFLLALPYSSGAADQRQYSQLDQIARQQRMMPRTNPQITCQRGRVQWVTQQYGTFYGRLTQINKLSVTIKDDYGSKFRIVKRNLSEENQQWIKNLQRWLRMRNAAYRRWKRLRRR